jgi:hypothetical protein
MADLVSTFQVCHPPKFVALAFPIAVAQMEVDAEAADYWMTTGLSSACPTWKHGINPASPPEVFMPWRFAMAMAFRHGLPPVTPILIS